MSHWTLRPRCGAASIEFPCSPFTVQRVSWYYYSSPFEFAAFEFAAKACAHTLSILSLSLSPRIPICCPPNPCAVQRLANARFLSSHSSLEIPARDSHSALPLAAVAPLPKAQGRRLPPALVPPLPLWGHKIVEMWSWRCARAPACRPPRCSGGRGRVSDLMLSCSPTPSSPVPSPLPSQPAQKEGLGELTEYGAVPYRASHVSSACGWGREGREGKEASTGAAQESSPSGRVARREGSPPPPPASLPPPPPASLPPPSRLPPASSLAWARLAPFASSS